jgi:hypothetical protein
LSAYCGRPEQAAPNTAPHRPNISATATIAANVPSVALNAIHLTPARVGSRELILQEVEFVQDSREVRLR